MSNKSIKFEHNGKVIRPATTYDHIDIEGEYGEIEPYLNTLKQALEEVSETLVSNDSEETDEELEEDVELEIKE